MIWFKCSQCGKTHGRPESSVGTIIFCECGHGNTVPWESTASEPQASPPPVDELHIPVLEPVLFDAEPVPAPPYRPPKATPVPPPPPRKERPPRPRGRRARPRRIDPNFCLNHESVPSEKACDECKERFCKNCLVECGSKVVCGPCKNFIVRTMNKPPRVSPLASISIVLGLLTCPLVFCIVPLANQPSNAFFNFIALLPQLFAVVLGALALRQIERDDKTSGRVAALTGMLSGGVSAVLTVIITLYIISGSAIWL